MTDNETALLVSAVLHHSPTLFTPTPRAAQRVLEFFTAQINNDHTLRAYLNGTRRFADGCDQRGIRELAGVQAFHVAAFIKDLQGQLSPPTVKQHLAALRMLFDWLVTGHVIDVTPAHAVRTQVRREKGQDARARGRRGSRAAGKHPGRPTDRRRRYRRGEGRPNRLARSRAHRSNDLYLCARERRAPDARA